MRFQDEQQVFSRNWNPMAPPAFEVARSRAAAFVVVLCFAVSLFASAVYGQDVPDVELPPCHEVALQVDSGIVANQAEQPQCVWTETIAVDDAKWLRLHFGEVILTKAEKQKSRLKITSLEDGAVQLLDAECCQQWRNKSAFFNGDAVKIELLAHANAEGNCVVIESVTVGVVPEQAVQESICDGLDNRVLSNSPRVARTNVGCTAWLFNSRSNDMITAGHCASSMTTVFFNVPLSDPDGTVNFPSPDDQYAVCADSIQFENGGVGSDWCYFGVFNNSNTGLTPLAAQGASYTLARPAAGTFDTNDFLRVTGYGATSVPVDPTWNQAQKTHAGPFVSLTGNALAYRPDTTGGNSGSPVTLGSTNIAYGVHTHGGCANGGGANRGTGLNHPDFWAAINNPQGVCVVPDNDNCEDATEIRRAGNFRFSTINASTDGPPLPADCDEGVGLSLVNDVWFEFTSPCSGSANFDFCDSDFDTRVAIYATGDACPEELLACNDDSCGLQSEVMLSVVEGEKYLIRVGGYSGNGSGIMTVTCAPDCSEHVEVVNGIMMIVATQMPDEIIVTQDSGLLEVRVNDMCLETFNLGEIERIVVYGYGGADLIQIDAVVETTLHGGYGADMIFGGDLSGDIFGGPGPDSIFGGPADDFIDAGRGVDVVDGMAGNDEILGGDSTDTLSGGPGDDKLYGGLGPDTILGGNGNDLIVGNAGADTLNGNGGNDELIGFGGPDELLGGPGNDDLTGGAGFDTLNGGGGIDSSLDNGEFEIAIEN